MFVPHFPGPPLSDYIQCLWYVTGQVQYAVEKILPTGSLDLIINLGSPHRRLSPDTGEFIAMNRRSWFVGMHSNFILVSPTAESHMIGIRFHPGGAHPFIDPDMKELNNEVVDMDLLWGREVDTLRERLLSAAGISERFKLLESELRQRLDEEYDEKGLISWTVERLTNLDEQRTVSQLCQELNLSVKHLNHLFARRVGLSPKALHRISRFNHVLDRIDVRGDIDWADIALQCQFFDQAHFIKDFKAFSGLTPKQYVRRRLSYFGADVKPGEGVHFIAAQ